MKIPDDYEIDPDKTVREISKELTSALGVIGVKIICKGRFLPEQETLRTLGIDKKDMLTILTLNGKQSKK